MRGSYLGPSFNNEQIEEELISLNAVYEKDEDSLIKTIVDNLKKIKLLVGFKVVWSLVQEL